MDFDCFLSKKSCEPYRKYPSCTATDPIMFTGCNRVQLVFFKNALKISFCDLNEIFITPRVDYFSTLTEIECKHHVAILALMLIKEDFAPTFAPGCKII